ncbi:MAG: FAD-binding oxidoreductase, partial [Pseudomonadota bacterium]
MIVLPAPQNPARLHLMDLPTEFLSRAKTLLGDKGWRMDAESLDAAATPWRGTYHGETPFLALPDSTEQVAALVKLCAELNIAITPQGGNTGLVDAGTPHGEITLSLRRMQNIRAVDPFNNSLTIEAGAPLVAAQTAADDANRLFPLSLGSE